ncbi:MAG: GMC family oxidoreductase N-terminal domain-containing protein [Gammaproteobacteria bacterium]
MIIQGHEIERDHTVAAHTVVVGSGSGGGVAAFHLAEAGVDTVVLEEGGYHVASEFNQREEDMFPMLYRNGGQQVTSDGMINVMQGSCYGGGTVINTSDCVPIPPEVLDHWQRVSGTTEISPGTLEESYERVGRFINVRRINKSLVNRNNNLLGDAAGKLGWKSHVMESNRKGCVGSGYCVVGCSYDARLGTNLTYLPWAMEKGARVYTDVRCDRIERLGSGRYRLHCTVVERGPRIPRAPLIVDCQRIVLAASAIHSPAILARSGLQPDLPQIGRNLTLQPQLGILSFFDEDIVHWRGAPQSVAVDEFDESTSEHGLSGFRMEGWGGVIGMPSALLPGFGHDHKRLTAKMRQMSITALLVPDQPSGSINYQWDEGGRVIPKIDYVMTAEWKQRLTRGMKKAGELLFSAGAREVSFTNQAFPLLTGPDQLDRLDRFPIEPGLANFVSAHNQGTCRMGSSKRNSVVDQNLRLHSGDDIYVMDASVMPSSASTHTMLPIMVMADRAIHRMLDA